jgi:hypothetical protein
VILCALCDAPIGERAEQVQATVSGYYLPLWPAYPIGIECVNRHRTEDATMLIKRRLTGGDDVRPIPTGEERGR